MIKRFIAIAVSLSAVFGMGNTAAAVSSNAYTPSSSYADRCAHDKNLPGEWKEIVAASSARHECEPPYRIVSKTLPDQVPASTLTPTGDALSADVCKIANANNSHFIGFPGNKFIGTYFTQRRFPSAKTVFQIVPLEAPDAPAGSHTPIKDYSKFFNWIKNYLTYISDYEGQVDFRVPDSYLKFSKPFKPFKVTHDNRDFTTFAKAAIGQVDNQIDFTGANVILFVAPAGTPVNIFSQQRFEPVSTNEGMVYNVGAAFPNTVKSERFDHSIAPLWWLHELYHGGLDLGDGFGDEQFKDGQNRGMGKWGLMSTGETEFLTWHKWMLGFTQDSQVACVDKSKTSTTWIVPSSYRSQKTKLAVIPLSKTKAIAIESIRAAGLNFKLGPKEQGALVYVVDSADTRNNQGFTVLRTAAKAKAQGTRNNYQKISPLYKGESVSFEGVRITNVEWGDFGDVIKVEPVK